MSGNENRVWNSMCQWEMYIGWMWHQQSLEQQHFSNKMRQSTSCWQSDSWSDGIPNAPFSFAGIIWIPVSEFTPAFLQISSRKQVGFRYFFKCIIPLGRAVFIEWWCVITLDRDKVVFFFAIMSVIFFLFVICKFSYFYYFSSFLILIFNLLLLHLRRP